MIEYMAQKITGKDKENFKNVPFSYLLVRGFSYFLGILRGKIKSTSLRGDKSRLFIGRRVKLFVKRQMFFGKNVRIEDYCQIDALSEEGNYFCDNVKIGSFSKVICSGTIANLGKGLKIGVNSYFSDYTFFGAAGGIQIGDNVIAGQNVRFHAENHNYKKTDV